MNLAIVKFIEKVQVDKGYTSGAQAARVLVQSLTPPGPSRVGQQKLTRNSLYDWIKRDSGGRAWLQALVSGAAPSADALSLKSRRSQGRVASTADEATLEVPTSPVLTSGHVGGRGGGEGSNNLFLGLSPTAKEAEGRGSPLMKGGLGD